MPTLYAILIPAVVVTLFLILSPNDLERHSRLTLLLHFLAISLLAFLWWTQINAALYINIRATFYCRIPRAYTSTTSIISIPCTSRSLSQLESKTDQDVPPLGNRRFPGSSTLEKKTRQLRLSFNQQKWKSGLEITVEKEHIRLSGSRQAVVETDLEIFSKIRNKSCRIFPEAMIPTSIFAQRHPYPAAGISPDPLLAISGLLSLCFSLFLGRHASAIAGIAVCCLLGALCCSYTPRIKETSQLAVFPECLRQITGKIRLRHSSKSTQTKSIFINSILHKACHSIRRYRFDTGWPGVSVSAASGRSSVPDHPHTGFPPQRGMSGALQHRQKEFPENHSKTSGDKVSDHWYVQLYTYNALRKLGWKQNASDSKQWASQWRPF